MRLDSRRVPFFAAFLVAGLTSAYAIRYGTFVAWGTDAAGYVGSAGRWATGELFGSAPIQLWGSFPNRGLIEMPLSYRFGPITGTDVNAYPLGFPVFLAPAHLIDRELGVYVPRRRLRAFSCGPRFWLGAGWPDRGLACWRRC